MSTKAKQYRFLIISIFTLITQFFFDTDLRSVNIKVLLEEKDSREKNHLQIKAKSNIYLQDLETNQKVLFDKEILDIFVKNNNIYISLQEKDKKVFKKLKTKQLRISPIDGLISFDKKTYQGDLILKIDTLSNTLFLINCLDLDNYIYSVLESESYQFWPLEMQKIQAIVSRTYAVHHMIENKKNSKKTKPYDIKKNNYDQTYNGLHKHSHLWQAIEDTNNLVLTYKNKIVLAMFDACCGGIIPADMKSLDFKIAPYLARKHKCDFCKNHKLYNWKQKISVEDFISNLKNNSRTSKYFSNPEKLGKLINIKITNKDKAGIVNKIVLNFSRKNITLTGKELWGSMKNIIKSQNFNIKKIDRKILIEGNGYGHQTGLCQWGARELVNKGWNFRNILSFYYPKTQLSRLTTHAKI